MVQQITSILYRSQVQLRRFFAIIDTDVREESLAAPEEQDIASVHDALVLGIKDYFAKTGFKKAVLGSGVGRQAPLRGDGVVCLRAPHVRRRRTMR